MSSIRRDAMMKLGRRLLTNPDAADIMAGLADRGQPSRSKISRTIEAASKQRPLIPFVATRPGGPILLALLLLPGFDIHDLAAVLDPLSLCNAVVEKEVFAWRTISPRGYRVKSSAGVWVSTNRTLADIPPHANLIVLGDPDEARALLSGLQQSIAGLLRYASTVVGVGGGCQILASTQALRNKRAVVHWESLSAMREAYRETTFLEELYAIDGNAVTCCGRSATVDFALYCVSNICGGRVARAVADKLNCERWRESNSMQCHSRIMHRRSMPPLLRRALALMDQHIDSPLTTTQIAKRAHVSIRHLHYSFIRYFGVTPRRFFERYRLQRARRLVYGTCLSMKKISIAVGFKSTSHFAKQYRETFGIQPSKDRAEGI
jgi:AraC family transcriptional regulator, glycine betaine-responsive activator